MMHNKYIIINILPTDPPCTSGFLSPFELRQQTLDVNINGVTSRNQQQHLFPEINFTCNGSITKWIVGAEMRASGTVQPELQIWRRDSWRRNRYTKVDFSLLIPNETSDPNIHEYYPDPPLEFQEGDILGVYTPRRDDSQLVVYYQENTGPQNYGRISVDPLAPTVFTYGNTASQIGYPLVTVEVSRADSTVMVAVSATSLSRASATQSLLLPRASSSMPLSSPSLPLSSPSPPLPTVISLQLSSSFSTAQGLSSPPPLPLSSPPSLPISSPPPLPLTSHPLLPVSLPTQPSLLPPQPSASVITLPARQLLGIEMMSVLIVGGVLLILAVVMVTTTVLICLRTRARKKQTQNIRQVGSNGSRGLEDHDYAFPVYSTPYSHKADCSDVTDQQMMMQSNPAYMSTATQGKANQSFPVEREECQYEIVGGINAQ